MLMVVSRIWDLWVVVPLLVAILGHKRGNPAHGCISKLL